MRAADLLRKMSRGGAGAAPPPPPGLIRVKPVRIDCSFSTNLESLTSKLTDLKKIHEEHVRRHIIQANYSHLLC